MSRGAPLPTAITTGYYGYDYGRRFYPYYAGPRPYYYGPYYGPAVTGRAWRS